MQYRNRETQKKGSGGWSNIMQKPVTKMKEIKVYFEQKKEENEAFKKFLKSYGSGKIDVHVQKIYKELNPKIDCTKCANCCKAMSVEVKSQDSKRLADHLEMDRKEFLNEYIKEDKKERTTVFSTSPCRFLENNLCTVYEIRPECCSEFPHLHRRDFILRIDRFMLDYGECPITFNLIERLKRATGFMK